MHDWWHHSQLNFYRYRQAAPHLMYSYSHSPFISRQHGLCFLHKRMVGLGTKVVGLLPPCVLPRLEGVLYALHEPHEIGEGGSLDIIRGIGEATGIGGTQIPLTDNDGADIESQFP